MIRNTTDLLTVSPKPARIPFDSAVWQMRDAGDFIHTKSGEVRDEDGFLSEADTPNFESDSEDWDAPKDSGWDDETGSTYGSAFDDGGGAHGFDDSSAQVRISRSASADRSDDRPSKLLSPKKKR